MARRGRRYYRTLNVGLIIILLIVLSLVISGTALGFALSRRRGGVLSINSLNFYAVVHGNFNNRQDANLVAQQVAASGGAGFVHLDSELDFVVIVAIYSREQEANLVSVRLSSEFQASVLPINIASVSLHSYSQDSAILLANYFNLAIESFFTLLNLSESLETSGITDAHASTILTQKRTTLNNRARDVLAIDDQELVDVIRTLSAFYTEFALSITSILSSSNRVSLASSIRYLTAVNLFSFYNIKINI